MPMCSYPLGCDQFAQKNSDRCSSHQVRNASEKKAESAYVQKIQREEAARQEQEASRQARDGAAQKKRDADLVREQRQAEVIRTHRQTWNGQIDAIVTQVLALRHQNPGTAGINAGDNAAGNTQGGTDSPVQLTMAGPTHGVRKSDIVNGMSGFDSSDSGFYKFRRQNVLVHCK